MLPTKTSVLDFLLVLLSFPDGHPTVITAFQNLAKASDEPRIFQILVRVLFETVAQRGIFGTKVKAKGRATDKEAKEFIVRYFYYRVPLMERRRLFV